MGEEERNAVVRGWMAHLAGLETEVVVSAVAIATPCMNYRLVVKTGNCWTRSSDLSSFL